MSDTGAQGLDLGTDATQDQVSDLNSLAEDFLKEIPESDRNVVAPHVKTWDSKVSQRFQKIHEEYKPYKEIGSPDEIKQWKAAVEFLQSNPMEAYKNLEKYLRDNNLLQDTQPPTTTPPVGDPSKPEPDVQGLPPEIAEQLKKIPELEGLVKQLSQTYLSERESAKAQEDAKQFDSWLDEMENKHGKFDRNYITFQLANAPAGVDAEKVVQEFVQNYGQPVQKPRTPPPLTAGAVPGTNTHVKDMTADQVKKLALAMLPKEN